MMMVAIVVLGLGRYQISVIEKYYNVDISDYETLYNPIKFAYIVTENVENNILSELESNSGKLEDREYLEQINSKLISKYSYVILRCGNDILYSGSDEDKDIVDLLPKYQSNTYSNSMCTYYGGDRQCIIKQNDFIAQDGTESSIFVVSKVGTIIPRMKFMIIEVLIAGIAITLLTGMFLTIWIYRSVVRPVKKDRKSVV